MPECRIDVEGDRAFFLDDVDEMKMSDSLLPSPSPQSPDYVKRLIQPHLHFCTGGTSLLQLFLSYRWYQMLDADTLMRPQAKAVCSLETTF